MTWGTQDVSLNAMGSALKTYWTGAYFALFTAEPNSSGSNEYSGGGYVRIAVPGWGTVSSGGDFAPTGLPVEFSGVAGASIAGVGLFSASTGGTYYGGDFATGDLVFNSLGKLLLTAFPVDLQKILRT